MVLRIEPCFECGSSTFVGLGGLAGEEVHGAVDVRVGSFVVPTHRVDHDGGFLGGRSVVEVGEGSPFDHPAEDREILPDRGWIESHGSSPPRSFINHRLSLKHRRRGGS